MKKEIILRWFRKAESDLKVVKHLLMIDEPQQMLYVFIVSKQLKNT